MSSLVPQRLVEKDPRNLAYLFPSLPLFKYKQATDDYYHLKTVQVIERVAKLIDRLIVPASCLHWERKKRFENQNIRIFGNSYYVLAPEDMSKVEKRKYYFMIEQIEGSESDSKRF